MTGSNRHPDWEEFLTIEGSPLSQEHGEKILLLAEGTRTLTVSWHKTADRMVLVPKGISTFVRALNPYIALCPASTSVEPHGFQLELFSHLAPRIWDMLGRGVKERVSIDEVLCYYEAIVFGLNTGKSKQELDFQLGQISVLRRHFGNITILQPAHARTVVL